VVECAFRKHCFGASSVLVGSGVFLCVCVYVYIYIYTHTHISYLRVHI
jgi:hypothetical protein